MSAKLKRVDAIAQKEVADWEDAHHYSPAPRHRRRLLLKLLDGLEFDNVLDAGCAQPYLLGDMIGRYGAVGFGCDISDRVIAQNRDALPTCEFMKLDLTREVWHQDRQFDLVVCSEVLEHVNNWEDALANLVRMTRRHLVITVPSGKLRTMDRLVGHVRHFQGPELVAALEKLGCRVGQNSRWGWPMHSIYKKLISALAPERLYEQFSGVARYGRAKRTLSDIIYRSFYANDLFGWGDQLLVHARVPESFWVSCRHSAVAKSREFGLTYTGEVS